MTDNRELSARERFHSMTPMIIFITIYMALCAFNFGYDVGNFGGVQGMQSFAKKFGEYNEATNLWALPSYLSSVMTATPFFGKAIGAMSSGWVAERYGRKIAVAILAIISLVGVTLQVSATTAAQFTVGRIVNFAMTGFTIVVVPIYLSECAPKALRGMINSTLQFMIIFGQTVASLVNYGTQHMEGDKAWQIPVGLQYLAPMIILALLPLLPESPRWLLACDRTEQATGSLSRLKPKSTSEQEIFAEIEMLRHANANEGKGSWGEVFAPGNRRRAMVAILAMFGQQITGQAFVNQYSVVFYQKTGFKSQAFLFTIINNIAGVAGAVLTWFLVDIMGRRPLLMAGGSLMATFLFIVAGVSLDHKPTQAGKNTMVASLALFNGMYDVSWGPISYVVVGEAAASRVKEKTNLIACVISILTTFVISFTVPYLLNAPYANLGGKVGFVYGSLCWAAVVATYFFIPEMKGRSLEEIDELFAMGISLRKFKGVKVNSPIEVHEHLSKALN